MVEPSVKVDDKLFQDTFNDYLTWTKKQPAEIVNAKLYFIALTALNTTKQADQGGIRRELTAPSQKYPNKSLGELLVLKQLQANGKMPKRGKTLAKNMANMVERFIKNRINHIQFLRSGWLPAIKKLDFWNKKGDLRFVKRFAPKKPEGVKQLGRDKGDVKPARLEQAVVRGTIYNYVGKGKQQTNTVQPILQAGLDKAVTKEIASMKQYIDRKYTERHAEMKRKGLVT